MSPGIGDTLPEFTIPSVSAEAMKSWAIFLVDPNPIHLDPAVVEAKGLGHRVINQGPANMAYVMNMLMSAFPGALIESMDSRFADNVYAGDQLTAGGTITAAEPGRIECDIWLRAAAREVVISGTAKLKLASPRWPAEP